MPSENDIQKWIDAVHQIMAEHPDWTEEQANAGLVWAVNTPETQAKISELAAQRVFDEATWTEVIRDLQERFPDWSEQECNDNLINLLEWAEANTESKEE